MKRKVILNLYPGMKIQRNADDAITIVSRVQKVSGIEDANGNYWFILKSEEYFWPAID